MDALPTSSAMQQFFERNLQWVDAHILTVETFWQLLVLTALVLTALLLARRQENILDTTTHSWPSFITPLIAPLRAILFPVIALILLAIYDISAQQLLWPHNIIHMAVSLMMAWVVIRFLSSIIIRRSIAQWIALIVFAIAAMDILGILAPFTAWLDSIGLTVKGNYFSLLTLAQGLAALAVMLWLAFALSHLTERQLRQTRALTPSMQVLLSKIVKILLLVLAVVLGLDALGIDLTAFTVFSGALGLGVGFGLQKVISNFISGIILLTDRSIKPGDVIAIDDTYGWVNSLNARHVSVLTRDGKEHLLPNELLITERVENWSYTDNNIRIRIPVGVSYTSDVRKALELLLEAAKETSRVLDNPRPNALIREFGESSVKLELRCWINDPVNGMGNIQSDIMLKIWDKFPAHGVTFPFPQRDVHIKNVPQDWKSS